MGRLTLATKQYDDTWFGVVVNDSGLMACSFSRSERSLEKHLQSGVGASVDKEPSPVTNSVLGEMIRIYAGNLTKQNVRLSWDRVSDYGKGVCGVMKEIPRGMVTTYGLIAKRLGSGPRAVGTAVGRNPWPLFVPCHRVVPASLEVGNYSIGGGLSDYGCAVKRELLGREMVPLVHDRVVSSAVWNPTGV